MVTVAHIREHRHTVYIGRAGHGQPGTFGNPFHIGRDGTREQVIARFREWLYSAEGTETRLRMIREIPPNAVLGCFCSPAPCHGDVIAELINNHHDYLRVHDASTRCSTLAELAPEGSGCSGDEETQDFLNNHGQGDPS